MVTVESFQYRRIIALRSILETADRGLLQATARVRDGTGDRGFGKTATINVAHWISATTHRMVGNHHFETSDDCGDHHFETSGRWG